MDPLTNGDRLLIALVVLGVIFVLMVANAYYGSKDRRTRGGDK